MRYLIYLLTITLILMTYSCKDNDATSNAPVASVTPGTSPLPNSTVSSTGGIEHYACPNGHVGQGGDAAGSCNECGAALEHNSAFHDSAPPADLTDQANNAEPNTAVAGTNSNVEHYICPEGHVGSGAAGAGQCAQCGAELTHNDAFHSTSPPSDLVNQVNNIDPNVAAPISNSGVEHYTCPNGHVGSGGAGEGTCAQCAAALVHNDAFHNSPVDGDNALPTSATTQEIIPQPSGALNPVFQNVGATGAPTVGGAAPALEPAQNTVGVWHYVCPDGHSGGAGSAQSCSACGKTLEHNAGYHN
ncbi:MAG: heavy metal-binding domain-containing protein [Saprospiraceae bacterium]